MTNNVELVSMLVKNGANVNAIIYKVEQNTPLMKGMYGLNRFYLKTNILKFVSYQPFKQGALT